MLKIVAAAVSSTYSQRSSIRSSSAEGDSMSAHLVLLCLAVGVTLSWCMLDSAAAAPAGDDQAIGDVRIALDQVRAATGFASAAKQPVTYLEGTARHHGLAGR